MAGLEFVSISHPDDMKKRETRRRIGQHVMKNIGQSRRKQPTHKKKAVEKTWSKDGLHTVQLDADAEMRALAEAIRSDTGRDVSEDFKKSPFTSLTRNYHARSQSLKNLLIGEQATMCQRQRAIYYTIAMIDDAALHLGLAEAALIEVGVRAGRFQSYPENQWAMQHYTACITMVNQRIQHSHELSYSLLGTILGLAVYDLTVRNFERWATHMKGLENMVTSRGGFKCLGSTYVVNCMLWIDMCGSLSMDNLTHFSSAINSERSKYPDFNSSAPLSIALSRTVDILNDRSPDFASLCTALKSCSELSRLASKTPAAGWMEHESFSRTVSDTGHRILGLPRRGETLSFSDSDDALHEVVRQAALLFVVGPVMKTCGDRGYFVQRAGCLPSLLRSEAIDWTGLEELELWVYFLGARIEEGDDRQWFVSHICGRMRNLYMGMKGLDRALNDITWMDEVLEKKTSSLRMGIKAALQKRDEGLIDPGLHQIF